MDGRAESAIRASVVSIGLGILGAALFKGASLGINFSLWMIAAFVAIVYSSKRNASPLSRTTLAGLVIATLSSLGTGWYSSPDLRVATWIALIGGLGVAALGLQQVRVAVASVWDVTGRMLSESCAALASGLVVPTEIPWKQLSESRTAQKQSAVFRGLLIATPLVLVFGSLFSRADAVFGQTVTNMFSFDIASISEWVMVAMLFSIAGLALVGAFTVPRVVRPPRLPGPGQNSALRKIGGTELTVVMCSLCGLFGLFVVIQFQYLFGGNAAVQETVGLSHADYARKGFFELVWVAGLALPLLVGAHAISPRDTRREVTTFLGLATVLTSLVLVVMASAMTRMMKYIESFGLTPMRVSVSAFMLWMVVVFCLFVFGLFRGRMDRFAFGAMATGFAVIAGLNFVTPDRMTARYNVARFSSTSDLDARHLASLGAESVHEVLANWDQLSSLAQAEVMKTYDGRFRERADWRGESGSEIRARSALEDFGSGS